jgi:PAS domain-containing protein
MMKQFINKIKSRVAFKLTFWVILLSMLITLVTSCIQLYFAYKRDLSSIEQYFNSISTVQLNRLSQSVWIMDDAQVQAHLDGILKARDIVYTAVVLNGEALWSSGSNNAREALTNNYNLNYSYKTFNYKLGSLQIVASLDALHERLFHTAKVNLFSNGLQIFLLTSCILFLFRSQVTRHLEKLAAHVVNIDFRTKHSSIKLDRNIAGTEDEFSQLVSMLNSMQRRGYNAFSAMEKSILRLRLFFDATEEGIFGINSEGRISFANSACLAKIGATNSYDIVGKKVETIFSYSSISDASITSSKEMFLQPLVSGRSHISEDGFLQVVNGPSFYAGVRTYPILSGELNSGAVVFF